MASINKHKAIKKYRFKFYFESLVAIVSILIILALVGFIGWTILEKMESYLLSPLLFSDRIKSSKNRKIYKEAFFKRDMQKVNKRIVNGIFGFLAMTVVVTAFVFSIEYFPQAVGDSTATDIHYRAQVCTYKTPWEGNSYGERELVGCSHNLLYNNGANMTRDYLGVGGTIGAITNISLCNASVACGVPVAGASEEFNTYTSCGMGSSAGTYAVVPISGGNWSVTKTFTSTCDNVLVNSTRLTNQTGSLFAGNTFTLVTLQNNDQLTVNWTISVS